MVVVVVVLYLLVVAVMILTCIFERIILASYPFNRRYATKTVKEDRGSRKPKEEIETRKERKNVDGNSYGSRPKMSGGERAALAINLFHLSHGPRVYGSGVVKIDSAGRKDGECAGSGCSMADQGEGKLVSQIISVIMKWGRTLKQQRQPRQRRSW